MSERETPITPDKILDALGRRDNRGQPKARIGPDGLGTGPRDPASALRRLAASVQDRERTVVRTTGVIVETAASGPGPEPGDGVGSR